MKPIPLEKQKEISRNWRDMKQGFYKQQRLIAELAAHPDVTDVLLLQHVRSLGDTYNHMKEVQHSLRELEHRHRFAYRVSLDTNF